MRSPRSLFALFAILGCTAGLQAQNLTNFGNTATNGGSWTYTPATSTISGTEGLGDLIFGTPLTPNIGTNRYLQLTGNTSTAPAGSFTITLEDNGGNEAVAHYTWGQFLNGATVSNALQYGTFNFSNIVGWSLDSGGSLQSVNASFSNLQAIAAVPEPSAFAICAVGLLAACIVRREVQKRKPAPLRVPASRTRRA